MVIMASTESYAGGENFDLRHILVHGRELGLHERMEFFQDFLKSIATDRETLTLRQIATAADRQVKVLNPHDGTQQSMLMFGSNNYLGLAHHPHVREKVQEVIRHAAPPVAGGAAGRPEGSRRCSSLFERIRGQRGGGHGAGESQRHCPV
jgi:hypothetical protein